MFECTVKVSGSRGVEGASIPIERGRERKGVYARLSGVTFFVLESREGKLNQAEKH